MNKKILTILLSALCLGAKAQDTTSLHNEQENVAKIFERCYTADNDSAKISGLNAATDNLESMLQDPSAFDYNFYKLENVSSIYSENREIRVLTFGVELQSGNYLYSGFIVTNNNGNIVITRLKDDFDKQENPQKSNMQANNWFGAIYYEIHQVGSKKYPVYALCGWDGADLFINRKVLEQIIIQEDGTPIFGGNFQRENSFKNTRIIFEFTEKAAMGLRFENSVKNMNGEKRRKVIVADHLTTPPEYKGNPRFSGPDMTFEGYYFQDGKWKYESILDIKLEQ